MVFFLHQTQKEDHYHLRSAYSPTPSFSSSLVTFSEKSSDSPETRILSPLLNGTGPSSALAEWRDGATLRKNHRQCRVDTELRIEIYSFYTWTDGGEVFNCRAEQKKRWSSNDFYWYFWYIPKRYPVHNESWSHFDHVFAECIRFKNVLIAFAFTATRCQLRNLKLGNCRPNHVWNR